MNKQLAPRELEIVVLIATKGYTYKEVSSLLDISPNTMKAYMERIFKKLEVNSMVKVVIWYYQDKLKAISNTSKHCG